MQSLPTPILLEDDVSSASVPPPHAQDISLEDLAQQLPEHQPRYIAYSYCYKHDDGRKSYPLCFIFVSPEGMGAGPLG